MHNWGWFTNQLKNTHFCICLQGIQDWPWWGYDFQTKGTANLRHVEICQVLLSADGLFQWRWLLYMDVTEFVLPTNMHKLNGSIRNLTIGNLFWTTQSGAVRLSQTGKVMRKMMIYQRILGPVFLPDHVFHYITKIYIDHHWSCHILIWTTIALSLVVTDHVQKDHMFLRIGPSHFDLYPICINLPILKNQNIWNENKIQINIPLHLINVPVVPHKAVADVSKIGNL